MYELDDPFLYDFMTGRQPIATLKIAKDINPEAFADIDLADGVRRLLPPDVRRLVPGLRRGRLTLLDPWPPVT